MKSYLVTWTSNGVEKKTMERIWEIKGLKDYLQYLTLKKEYEAKKTNASLTSKRTKLNMFYNNFMFLMKR
jgi:hypothetical protein